MQEDRSLRAAIEQASRDLEQDHRRIDKLASRLRVSSEADLAPVVRELRDSLHEHFAHEEHPGGLYDRMGACSVRYRERVRTLVDEHYRIMAAVRVLRDMLESPSATNVDPESEARKIADWLHAHEVREHELAHAAIEGRG